MASAFHRCHHCGYEMEISSTLAAFEDNPHCRQCGLSVSESDAKMQDDLINMMTRNLQINSIHQRLDVSMPPTPQVGVQSSPITYITQHYHHSAHQATMPDAVAFTTLENAGVNVSILFPSQMQLFRDASSEEQRRLIDLWTIAPLTSEYQMIAKNLGTWNHASMEQEEEAAKHRWETSVQYRSHNVPNLLDRETNSHAEPYLIHGYENLPNTRNPTKPEQSTVFLKSPSDNNSSDPLYRSREWWHMTDDEPMEHQYGMLQQMMYTYPINYGTRVKDDEEMS